MDLLNNCERSETTKAEFKTWLKNYNEQLSTRNKLLKSQFQDKQKRNNDLKLKIGELVNNNLDTKMVALDVVPNKAHSQIEGGINKLKTKAEQVQKCNKTIDTKFEEETKKLRKIYYEMITKNELALKPYHEVENAVMNLTQQTYLNQKQQKEDKEIFIQLLKDRAQVFLRLKKDIALMEPIEQEMKVQIEHFSKAVKDKLKSLKITRFEEACDTSSESKELLQDIYNLKSQLN